MTRIPHPALLIAALFILQSSFFIGIGLAQITNTLTNTAPAAIPAETLDENAWYVEMQQNANWLNKIVASIEGLPKPSLVFVFVVFVSYTIIRSKYIENKWVVPVSAVLGITFCFVPDPPAAKIMIYAVLSIGAATAVVLLQDKAFKPLVQKFPWLSFLFGSKEEEEKKQTAENAAAAPAVPAVPATVVVLTAAPPPPPIT